MDKTMNGFMIQFHIDGVNVLEIVGEELFVIK